jgi:hypothetical protein
MKRSLVHFALYAAIVIFGNLLAYHIVHIPHRMELMGIVMLLALYPVFRRPITGMYILVIGMPFVGHVRRLYYLVYERPAVDALLIFEEAVLAIILVALVFQFRTLWENGGRYRTALVWMCVYFGYMLLRVFVVNINDPVAALMEFKFYGPPVLFFFVGMVFAYHVSHLRALLALTVVLGGLSVLYGIKQLHVGYNEAEKIWFGSIEFTTLFVENIIRPFSFFKAPVAFADYAQLAIIAAMVLCVTVRARLVKIVMWALFPLFVYGILITSVRSNWIGLICSVFVWFFVVNMQRLSRKITVISLLLLGYVGYHVGMGVLGGGASGAANNPFFSRQVLESAYFTSLVTERSGALVRPFQEHSFISRIELGRQMFVYSVDPINALLGRGLGALKTDSLYVTYLAEFGYPGFFGIIAIFAVFILSGLRVQRHIEDGHMRALVKGVTVMNIVFFVISGTGTHIHYFPGTVYFWFFNGVLIRYVIDRTGQGYGPGGMPATAGAGMRAPATAAPADAAATTGRGVDREVPA